MLSAMKRVVRCQKMGRHATQARHHSPNIPSIIDKHHSPNIPSIIDKHHSPNIPSIIDKHHSPNIPSITDLVMLVCFTQSTITADTYA
jgi:hypothetical protein